MCVIFYACFVNLIWEQSVQGVDFGNDYFKCQTHKLVCCSGDGSRPREHDPLPKSTHGQIVTRMPRPY